MWLHLEFLVKAFAFWGGRQILIFILLRPTTLFLGTLTDRPSLVFLVFWGPYSDSKLGCSVGHKSFTLRRGPVVAP